MDNKELDNINQKNEEVEKRLIDSKQLREMLGCGRSTAEKIGNEAGAKVKIGKRVLWNVKKIDEHLEKISK